MALHGALMRSLSPSADHNVASLLARSGARVAAPARARAWRDGAARLSQRSRSAWRSSPARSHACGLAPAIASPLVSRNVPEYVEALFACWWAGLVAVPVNAKLHPRELAFVLADSGARWAFVDARVAGGDRVARANGAPTLAARRRARRRGVRTARRADRAPSAARRVRARRSGVALLHERHDRTAEGRGDHARQSRSR